VPISELDILEFVSDSVLLQPFHRRSAPKPMSYNDDTNSFFEAPSDELKQTSVTLTDLLNGEPDLLHAAIARWRDAGHAEQCIDALEAIANYLDQNGDPQASMTGIRAKRAEDFVYPVF
jgi:hypothetical protein